MQFLVIAGLAVWFLASLPVALYALWRLGELRRRVADLERRADRRASAPAAAAARPLPEPAAGASAPAAAPPAPLRLEPDGGPPAREAEVEEPAPSSPASAPPARPAAPPGSGLELAPLAPRGPAPAPAADEPVGDAPPAPPARPGIEWERWLGVRGAAVLGGVAAALAAVFFFQHAVAEGWIRFTPVLRVATGLAFGAGLLAAGEGLRRRAVRVVPEALSGAGVVALYASLWAAQQLYGLVGPVVGFAGMVAVTALCGVLAVRRASPLIATLGLLGGFATPLLVAAEDAGPGRLFLYLFLLDLGLLAVARSRRWAWIGVLGWAGTVAYQVLWILGRGDVEPGVSLVVVGVFGLLFLFAPLGAGFERTPLGRALSAAGLAVPLLFSGLLQADFGEHVLPVAGLLVALAAGASWIGARQGPSALPLAVALGSAAVLAAWGLGGSRGEAGAWELCGAAIAVALPTALAHELNRRRALGAVEAAAFAARGAAPALLAGLVVALSVDQGTSFLPWAAGFAALGALTYRAWGAAARGAGPVAAAVLVGLGWRLFAVGTLVAQPEPSGEARAHAAVVLATLAVLALAAWRWRPVEAARAGWLALAAFATVQLAMGLAPRRLWVGEHELRALLAVALALPLAAVAARRGAAWLVGLGALVATWALWGLPAGQLASASRDAGLLAALGAVGAGAFLVLPVLLRPGARAAVWTAAATPLLWVGAAEHQLRHGLDPAWEGVPQLAVGAVGVLLALRAARAGERDARRAAETVAVVLSAVGLARVVGHHADLVAPALTGVGLVALWRRDPLPAWKLGAVLALLYAAGAVCLPALVPGWLAAHERAVLNPLGYAHALALASLATSAALLAPLEAARRTALERRAPLQRPAFAVVAAAGAVAGFAALNVAVLDAFGRADRIGYGLAHAEGRDLALSIAWAVYALGLLGAGTARRSAAPRWASLVLLVATLLKVFLVDLGELEGLLRVASLLGLALALLAVSLLYQRFVFRRPAAAGSAAPGPPA